MPGPEHKVWGMKVELEKMSNKRIKIDVSPEIVLLTRETALAAAALEATAKLKAALAAAALEATTKLEAALAAAALEATAKLEAALAAAALEATTKLEAAALEAKAKLEAAAREAALAKLLIQRNATRFEHACIASVKESNNDPCISTFHWNDVPHQTLLDTGFHISDACKARKINGPDHGADGVIVRRGANGRVVAHALVQSKNYTRNSLLGVNNLGTFFHLIVDNRLALYCPELPHLIFATDETNLQRALVKTLDMQYKALNIQLRRLPAIKTDDAAPVAALTPAAARPPLWPHQEEAIKAVCALFDRNVERTLLMMPPGAGKTLTADAILRYLKPTLTIITSPLIALAEQNAHVFRDHPSPVYVWSGVCKCDAPNIKTKIENACARDTEGRATIFTTNKSARQMAEALRDFKSYTLIVDEGHNTTFRDDVISLANGAERTLVLTGTGTCAMSQAYGNPLIGYQMRLRDGIKAKIITDYKLVFPCATSVESGLRLDTLRGMDSENTEVAKVLFLVSEMLLRGKRRAIVFAGTIEQCREACTLVKKVCEEHFNVGCTAACVTADTNKAERRRFFEAFQSPNTTPRTMLFFLFSVRILSEGIDLPLTDTVMWLNGPSLGEEKVRFVQELCRAVRLVEGKDYALCIVWASVLDMRLTDAIGRLLEEDPLLNSRISFSDGAYDKLMVKRKERKKIMKGMATSVDEFLKRFKLVPVEIDDGWVTFESAITAFYKREKHCLVPRKHVERMDGVDVPLGSRVSSVRRGGMLGGPESAQRHDFLNSIGFVWNVHDEVYVMFKDHFKAFVDREHHGNVPYKHTETLMAVGAKPYTLGDHCDKVRNKGSMLHGHSDEAARREELISIGFVFDPSETKFNLLVKGLENYQRLNGETSSPPQAYVAPGEQYTLGSQWSATRHKGTSLGKGEVRAGRVAILAAMGLVVVHKA
ncbi:P-loop containing nucleoside triphosphate hydrolase protein [Pavlovales sp. CCMP2436]|nr:P-loop containing nucleoside triphosphate hydrolase protein [Pavlovales sp. CCMP2436]